MVGESVEDDRSFDTIHPLSSTEHLELISVAAVEVCNIGEAPIWRNNIFCPTLTVAMPPKKSLSPGIAISEPVRVQWLRSDPRQYLSQTPHSAANHLAVAKASEKGFSSRAGETL